MFALKPFSIFLTLLLLWVSVTDVSAQTKIAREQIEDAFLLKTGGNLYGDLNAATSTIRAASLQLESDTNVFYLRQEGPLAIIRSNGDLLLDPTSQGTANAHIRAATVIKFPEYLGDRLVFYSDAYKIGVSPFNLDITSDRNIRFHSDTVPDLMVIEGDQGNVTVKQDITSGGNISADGVFSFTQDTFGNRIELFGEEYRIGVSSETLEFHSDRYFKWQADDTLPATTLDTDTGRLSLAGALKLSIHSSLPEGTLGDLIYLDHPSDDSQDGAYIYTGSGWVKL
ncbi:MAG: hypothetical protein ACOX5R_04785 [bacterium]|jgi:hypothetical protein